MVIPIRDENPTRRRAYVTIALIAINLVVYFAIQFPKQSDSSEFISFIPGASAADDFTLEYAAIPCELQTGEPLTLADYVTKRCDVDRNAVSATTGRVFPDEPFNPDKNVWLAVLFSTFLHGSILHVLGNMLFLWVFGNNVEDVLGPIGFLVFYLAAGFASAAVHVLGNLDQTVPFIGASGAVAGVMGAYIVWFPRTRVLSFVPLLFFFGLLRLPAAVVLGLWFFLQFITQSTGGVAWLAHVGGFVFGALVALALRGLVPPRPPPVESGWRGPPITGSGGGFRGGYPGRD